ncbi:iron-siderophore ABC transporter substrate-binding protein [Sedimentitalea sp.]|uniref:iron-siderophore ABC transporter substrate-binding protein n=1 Tax=Sedimentitalea sp. TaxID=2048915 RepID=UPI0032974A84
MISRILLTVAFLVSAPVAAFACAGQLIKDERIHASPLCVPADPQRIVVMDQSFALGIGLELGLPIVGAPLNRMSDEDLLARAQAVGVEDLGFVTEPNLERIVALQPDLIIGFTGDPGLAESFYPMLSSLAPTLLDISGDWQGFYDILGGLTGQQDKVEALFADYSARLQDIRERVPETAVSILRITPWDFQVYTDTPGAYAPFQVLSDAGVRRSAYETAPDGPALKRPDWEELSQLDGEVLLYIVGGTNDSATSGRHEEVVGNPLWRLLPAVQAGQVHQIDPATWMEFSGLPSAHRVLDDIEHLIINRE